ncbi:MAG: transferase hexapeptide repeat containing protein [Oculatellaceae cyanobacterium Prado106]|jgi:hypothetical protein|nr:transferase hexapeptide repeat containing protein [Oculatellaceae cyanobacterium Prado106]
MSNETTLESRLTALEQVVAELQYKVESQSNSRNWLQTLTGSISDETAFLEALEHGRVYRQADKPLDESNL